MNKQNYAVYVFMVQDGMGLAQVVGVFWLASEKEENVSHVVQEFKKAHGNSWCATKVVMVDKDFVEIKICEREFR